MKMLIADDDARFHADDLGPWQNFVTATEALLAIDPVLLAMTAADYSRKDQFGMRLAMEEAIVNAVRHGNRNDPSKYVRIRWHVSAVRSLVEVEDEGDGFDPQAVADPLTTDNLTRSSGRGVLLMRSYTSWVRYNSRGNRVTLCRTAAHAAKSLLIVEDDGDTRTALSQTLLSAGYAVLIAANGQEALGQLRDGPPPSLIVLDLMLPVMNGWQFRAQQRRDPVLATIPVVVMSAIADVQRNAAGLEAAAYVQKPFPMDTLVDIVRQHC